MATSHTPVTAAPVLVYSPASQGVPHVTLFNEGAATAYVGQAGVTVTSGLPLAPRQSVTLPFCPFPLYACSGAVTTATTVNTNAAAASGATTLSFAGNYGSASTAAPGLQVQVGSGSAAETVTIVSGGGTATLTVSALQYDHKTASPVTVVTAAGVSVHAESGF